MPAKKVRRPDEVQFKFNMDEQGRYPYVCPVCLENGRLVTVAASRADGNQPVRCWNCLTVLFDAAPTQDAATPMADALRSDGYAMTPNEWVDRIVAAPDPGIEELYQWWMSVAQSDLDNLTPKAREYSAHDLIMVGQQLALTVGWDANDRDAAEIACWFYLLGKVGRAMGAIKEHRLPSGDTLVDARIYPTMIARIRDAGSWPGL